MEFRHKLYLLWAYSTRHHLSNLKSLPLSYKNLILSNPYCGFYFLPKKNKQTYLYLLNPIVSISIVCIYINIYIWVWPWKMVDRWTSFGNIFRPITISISIILIQINGHGALGPYTFLSVYRKYLAFRALKIKPWFE